MATENDTSITEVSTPNQLPRETQFATEYETPHELLLARLYQAGALSALLKGDGFETVKTYADDIQQGVFWALHSLIHDAQIAATRLGGAGGAA
jgi:hypothetical protein